jgi:hypothetical protein
MDRGIYILLFLIKFCGAGASLAVFGQKNICFSAEMSPGAIHAK